ncbi:MAG: lambda exonuclease family protein [Thiohalomonadales bacterium]
MIIHDCEQGTDEWKLFRSTIPTGSNFKKLITDKGIESKSIDDYAIDLAAAKFIGQPVDGFTGSKYMDRGTELEPEAVCDYEMKMQVNVDFVGFITNDIKTYGCSPDGLVGNDGSIEVKCSSAKEHIKILIDHKRTGQIPSHYFAQPQGVMLVAERKWCDLVFYHPDLPGLIVRQYPDNNFLTVLKKQLKSVIIKRNVILKQLEQM